MRKAWVLIAAVSILSGCPGCASEEIDYKEMTVAEMSERWGENEFSMVLGHAEWDQGGCTIYLAPRAQYWSEACYQAVVAHEQRHCDEGDFHAGEGEIGYIPECFE